MVRANGAYIYDYALSLDDESGEFLRYVCPEP